MNMTTDPDEARRQHEAYAAAAVPIREIILARREGRDDLVVFWLDTSGRPDLADLARVHISEGEGRFVITPSMFAVREGFVFNIGLAIDVFDPVKCSFKLMFDYFANREWYMHLLATGRFGVETKDPDAAGDPPNEGAFLTLILDHAIQTQAMQQALQIEATHDLFLYAHPAIVEKRLVVPSLYRERVWIARAIGNEAPPAPKVGRGRNAPRLRPYDDRNN
jgi:hypothetical protein